MEKATKKEIERRKSLTTDEWIEDWLIRNKVEDVSFTIFPSETTTVEELKEEFRRLETLVEEGKDIPLPKEVPYHQPELNKAIEEYLRQQKKKQEDNDAIKR